jgi:probable rRNA maturation factor
MLEVAVSDEADAWEAAGVDLAFVEAVLTRAASEAGLSGAVAVLLSDDAALADLNGAWRGKPQPTNVLAFPAPHTAAPHLGDIALAFETVSREAADQGKLLRAHAAHLLVHGLLHLAGYDHMTESEAMEMEAVERRLLAAQGYPDPY